MLPWVPDAFLALLSLSYSTPLMSHIFVHLRHLIIIPDILRKCFAREPLVPRESLLGISTENRFDHILGTLVKPPKMEKTTYQIPRVCPRGIIAIIIQHIDTLPKYGKKTLDVRRST